MAKKIKNIDTIQHTWGGTVVLPSDIYECQNLSEQSLFANDNSFLLDFSNSKAEVYNDTLKIVLLSDVIATLLDKEPKQNSPFASKVINGKKLFRRKHGFRVNCPANSDTTLTFVVPYDLCKIDEVEIINCSGNDNIDLKILDTATGTFSTIPNFMLNQFGFDVCLSDLYYSDSSNYDADLYKGMQVQLIFKNKDSSVKNIGINVVLHEVK